MVSRITGSVGKGLAAITMDKEFQQKRREEMNRAPKDFGESLAKGGMGLLKVATLLAPPPTPVSRPHSLTHELFFCLQGVMGGVTGIVTKPVEGE